MATVPVSDKLWKKLQDDYHFSNLIRNDTRQLPPTDTYSMMRFNCVAASFFGASTVRIEFPQELKPTPDKFNEFYKHFGFEMCKESDDGVVIDVWGTEGKFKHVSVLRTVEGHGKLWQSKLGQEEFITHNRMGLEGAKYGKYLYSFRRTSQKPLPTEDEMLDQYDEDLDWGEKYGVALMR